MSDPVKFQFPEAFGPLFKPHRYKVFYGGRGGAKSWAFARALLLEGADRTLRILCTREVQRSIKDSVHKLLSDQIEALGLGGFYEILQNEIRGANGTEIVFSGLSSQTRESIKSFEGVDICWVEEAQVVSKRSWDILIPTIRKPASELWISFNPDLETDETYQRFVVNAPTDSVVTQVNWSANPWFPDVLRQEMADMKARSLDDYMHIWEGQCRPAVEGAIYFREVSDLRSSGRLCNVPYDPLLKVHAVWDLGYADYMSIILVQRHASELRVIRYIEDHHRTLADYSADLRQLNYNWGKCWLPHDGRAKDYRSGKSAEEILRALNWDVEIIEDIGVEQGINAARMKFPLCYIDKTNADELVNRLARYKRRTNPETGVTGSPVHDEHSHGADAFRYLGVIADQISNSASKAYDPYRGFRRHG